MIKTAIKNFFRNLIYVFVPMGIIYLFVLTGLFAFGGAALSGASDMLGSLSELVSSTVETSGISVTKFLEYAAEELQGKDFFETVKYILDTDWIQKTVREFFELLDASSNDFSDQFAAIVTDFSESIKLALGLAISWIVVGLTLANFATRFVVRRRSAKRGVKKWIVANTLIPIVQSLIIAGATALAAVVKYYTWLFVIVIFAAYGTVALVSSWIIHGRKFVPYKQVVNIKNILRLLLAVLVILLLVVGVFFLITLFDPLVAVLVVIPVVVYALNIISVNTDSYVCSLVEKAQAKEAAAEMAE